MSYKSKNQLLSHDAAGVESARIDWSEFSDEYGNHVTHGDLSMQRMVEEGVRDTRAMRFESDHLVTEGYDKEPMMSKVQNRYLRSAEARGDVPAGTASKLAHHTPGGIGSLPERKHGGR